MDIIDLIAFRAPERPDLCIEFLREHRQVLADFGITKVTSNNTEWMSDPDCIVIVAIHEHLGMVGGIRLQRAHRNDPLPIERSLINLDPRITSEIEELRAYNVGEVCGLWNANRYAGHGVPWLLSQAVTAISVPAGSRKMVCFVAHYTQKHPKRNGFIPMTSLGDNGTFPEYPIPRIIAIAMVNPDTMLLEHCTLEHRQLIYSLRLRPEQMRIESPSGVPMEVHYQLRLKGSMLDLHAYRMIEEQRLRYTA